MVVLHMNRKSTHDGCSFLLVSASVTFFFMFTSDDTLHHTFLLVRSLMERSADMNYKSYTNADRERRAREGRSPCKKPYCTGEYCLREPQLCRAWRIYNQYRKEMGRSGAIESARR